MAAHVVKSELHIAKSAHQSCSVCGESRQLERIMIAPAGPVCDSCTIGAESDANARLAARGDFGVGPRMALATTAAIGVAVAAFLAAEPLVAVPATGLAAGLAMLSLVWGSWAALTGGDGRLVPSSVWGTAIRASGGVAVASGVLAGGVALALAVWPYVAIAL